MPVPVRRYAFDDHLLQRAGFELTDLHVHTTRSDALVQPADAVSQARELGIRIAITDHNRVDGAIDAWQAARGDATQRVVPGIEVTTHERVHILLYFRVPDDLMAFHDRVLVPCQRRHAHATTPYDISVQELLAEAAMIDCITSAAHPYAAVFNGVMTARKRYGLGADQLQRITAIEVVNGVESARNNRRAKRLARRLGKVATAGSDAHTRSEIGAVTVATPASDDFFVALRRGHAVVFDRTRGRIVTLLGHSAKLPFHVSRPFKRIRSMAEEYLESRRS